MEPKKAPNPDVPKSFQDSLKMGGLGGLSTPRQAPIRAGDRKTTYPNLQEELKFFVVGHPDRHLFAQVIEKLPAQTSKKN